MAIKKILISQETPMNKAPYDSLVEKFGVQIDFKPFFLIEPLTSREFRTQRLNILDFTAIVFSARHTIDAFFRICDELRIKVPETMKYFCTTEAVAMYLQKHIVFRKRKIFYGNGTPSSVIDLIGPKHKDEKFLIATSDSSNVEAITSLFRPRAWTIPHPYSSSQCRRTSGTWILTPMISWYSTTLPTSSRSTPIFLSSSRGMPGS